MNYDDMHLETYRRTAAYVLKSVDMDADLENGMDYDLAVGIFRKIWKREPQGLASWLESKDAACEERFAES